MKPHRPFELQEYNPEWKKRFAEAAEKLKPIFGDNLIEIDHVGSTSIKGMLAKPQIDILVVVKDLDLVKNYYKAFIKLGFVPRGRGYVANNDEYFTKDSPNGKRLMGVHTLQEGDPKIIEYKIFRDYLCKNAKDRNLYIATKQKLYSSHSNNYAKYGKGKHNVITTINTRAKKWAGIQKITT